MVLVGVTSLAQTMRSVIENTLSVTMDEDAAPCEGSAARREECAARRFDMPYSRTKLTYRS